MAILKNSVIVSVWTVVSRWLGFARDLLIANKLGATDAADAFFIALMLPNLFRRLFAEGAFNVAFVPILARHKGVSQEEAMRFANAAFSWLLLVVSMVTVAGVIFMPVLVMVLASGYAALPAKFALAVELGRICFPYLGLITVAAFLGALCNTFGKFAAYAMVPALLNISILVCLFALPGMGADPAWAAAWSIPLGGIAQVAYMLWAARRLGLDLTLAWLPRHADLRTLLVRLGPAVVGVGVLQLSIIIDNSVASHLPGTAVTYLQFANRFYQLPLSVVGIAVATVLLPELAVLLGKGDKKQAASTFTDALAGCLVIALGAAVGMFILAPEMMEVSLAHGAFTPEAARMSAWAMMAFVAGLPAYIVTKVTAPAFFASGDPVRPVKASAVALGVNLVMNITVLLLAQRYGFENVAHVGIAASTAVGGYANAALQWHWLNQRGVLEIDRPKFGRDVVKMLGVAGALAVVLVLGKVFLPYNADWLLVVRIVWLGAMMAVGGAVFAGALEVSGLISLRALARRVRNRRKVTLPGAASGGSGGAAL
ncbi:MAG: murein biosynthesis integral membrane protein MurJ [Proteobacteria bacterium]|nr:murein biosynthesis integral membrane protein MurJ [Pseudomonadota bacterium]